MKSKIFLSFFLLLATVLSSPLYADNVCELKGYKQGKTMEGQRIRGLSRDYFSKVLKNIDLEQCKEEAKNFLSYHVVENLCAQINIPTESLYCFVNMSVFKVKYKFTSDAGDSKFGTVRL